MLGLFGKKKVDTKKVEKKYNEDRKHLLDLLEKDLKIIDHEKDILKDAVEKLKQSKETSRNLSVIKQRLSMIKKALQKEDEDTKKQMEDEPQQRTILQHLEGEAEKLKEQLNTQK